MISRQLSTPGNTGSRSWFECVFFTLFALVVPALLNPDDPFVWQGEFIWPMLGPLLVALRYGFTKGLVSVLLMLFAQTMLIRAGLPEPGLPVPFQAIAGYALFVMLCGEFTDWRGKISEKQKRELAYVNDRLETFTRHYHLLHLSHDKLEQMLAGHSLSLRESLQAVKKQIGQIPDRDIELVAQPIMNLFVEYGSLQSAALYKAENGKLTTQLAGTGPVQPVKQSDAMVQRMFESGELVSLKNFSGDSIEQSQYQVVIPLADVSGHIYAAILVEQIQFFALNKSTLILLAVTAGYIADLLRNVIVNPVLGSDEHDSFCQQAARANHDAKRYKVPAQVVSWSLNQLQHQSVLDYLHATRRGLDVYYYDPHTGVMLMLMPLADERDYSGFKHRVDDWAKSTQGQTLEEAGIRQLNQLTLPVAGKQLEKMLHVDE